MLTSQFVDRQFEHRQCRAQAEFRRNVACAARRSVLDVGTLVSQQGTMSTKMRTGQFVDLEIEVVHIGAAPQLGWNSTCKIID
jgi:hypothetical protein